MNHNLDDFAGLFRRKSLGSIYSKTPRENLTYMDLDLMEAVVTMTDLDMVANPFDEHLSIRADRYMVEVS